MAKRKRLNKQQAAASMGWTPRSNAKQYTRVANGSVSVDRLLSNANVSKNARKNMKNKIYRAPRMEPALAEFIECVCNPFGSEVNGGWKSIGARFPDGHCHTEVLSLFASCTCTGHATGQNTYFALLPPDYTAGNIGAKYGNHTTNLVNGIQAINADSALYPAEQATELIAKLVPFATAIQQYRVVGGGIRLICTSTADNTSGTVRCYYADQNNNTTPGNAWARDIACITYDPIEEVRSLIPGEGITVRVPASHRGFVQAHANAFSINTAMPLRMPIIRVETDNANTAWRVEFVIHIETKMSSSKSSSIPLRPVASNNLLPAIQYCNEQELVVGANSFKSFLSKIRGYGAKGWSWYRHNQDMIDPLISNIGKLVI